MNTHPLRGGKHVSSENVAVIHCETCGQWSATFDQHKPLMAAHVLPPGHVVLYDPPLVSLENFVAVMAGHMPSTRFLHCPGMLVP